MQNQYTRQAERAIKYAARMARKLKHPYIGTEHLLLGLRSEITGVAGQVLASHGVDEEQLLHLMDELIVPGEEILQQDDPKESPRLEYILENAKKEALHLRTGDVGTEHLLLAIMHDADCVAARMLITLNINCFVRKISVCDVLL